MKAQSLTLERREIAILSEQVASDRIALLDVWQELRSGQTRILDGFITDERCYLLLSPPVPFGEQCKLSERRSFILNGLLCGEPIKALAIDLGLSQSMVSHEAKAALRQLGLECTASRVNPLLAMLARAALDAQPNRYARSACVVDGDTMFRVVGMERPDVRLAPILPPAELAVVRGLVEGRNHREIAANRGTSTRTVANQLAAAFRKLGVSGRFRLLNHIVSGAGALA